MRIMVKRLVASNVAIRMMFVTGVLGFGLMAIDGLLHAMPELSTLAGFWPAARVQGQLILLASIGLFAAAYMAARAEQGEAPKFMRMMMEFWEFRPLKEARRSHRLLEWAHIALILLMFHRAVFTAI